jgi:AbrB family looped-hinge helix DNA binding protein
MDSSTVIDKSGRLVLPKPVRDALGLRAGDRLTVRREGQDIILSVNLPKAVLHKEKGVWVYRSGQPTGVSIPQLIQQERCQQAADLS